MKAKLKLVKMIPVHAVVAKSIKSEWKRLSNLAKHLKTLQIGIRTDELLNKSTHTIEKLKALVTQMNEYNSFLMRYKKCLEH